MKYILSLIILACLLSCNNKEYKGNWTYDRFRASSSDTPKSIILNKGSITLNFSVFNHYHKYPLKIKRKELWFNSKLLCLVCIRNNDSFYILVVLPVG